MSNYSDSGFKEGSANTSWYKVFNAVPEKTTVLDIGCSSGNFGQELIARKQCIVDGIELDKKDAETAGKKLRKVWQLNIETGSISSIKGKYDIIYFGDVIEHLVNPSKTLERVKSLLKPGGKILFSIPNMSHVAIRLMLLKGDFEYTETGLLDKTHLHFYSLEEVYTVFREAGFEIDDIDFVDKDYPRELIQKWLAGIGLKGDKSFYEAMRQPDASAFQFVGTAIVAKKPIPVKRPQFGPIDMFESFHRNTIGSHEQSIKSLELKYDDLESRYNELNDRWNALKRNPPRFVAGAIKRKLKSS